MDKFDESIQQAQQTYEPTEGFVDMTMQHITGNKSRKNWHIKFWVPALAGGLVVIALVFAALPFGNHTTASHTRMSVAGSTQGSSSPQTATAMPSGTSNADLTSDMNAVNGAMNQENTDQNSANSALNDSTQQITVPTD